MSIAVDIPLGLATKVATWQHEAMRIPLDSLNDRAWYAYQCLPRVAPTNRLGKKAKNLTGLPAYGKIEAAHDLPGAVLSKLFSGERKSLDTKTLIPLAKALGVSVDWLATGVGESPTLTGVFEPRAEQYAQFDPARWAEQYSENPVALARGARQYANPFEEAADAVKERVPRRWLAKQREEARGHEWDRPAAGWTLHLIENAPTSDPEPNVPPVVAVPEPKKKAAG